MPTPPARVDTEPPSPEPGRVFGVPELLAGLRTGKAGFGVRAIITVAIIAFAVACMTGLLGLIEASSGVREWHVAVVVPAFSILGLAAIYMVWATYGRWRPVLKTAFVVLCLLVLTVGACITVGLLGRRLEPVVVAIAFAGASVIIVVIAAAIHLGLRGRPVRTTDGAIRVECPGCGYSMSGLESTACPECGHRCTIDELIRAQDYDGARAFPPASPNLPPSVPALASTPAP